MASSVFRGVQQGGGVGLYALPAAAIALTPPLLLVYLGVRIMRAERMAVYGLAVVMLMSGGAMMLFDARLGGYVLLAALVGLAPLCRAAMREPGGFH